MVDNTGGDCVYQLVRHVGHATRAQRTTTAVQFRRTRGLSGNRRVNSLMQMSEDQAQYITRQNTISVRHST